MDSIFIWIGLFLAGFFIIYFTADVFIDNLKELCIIYNVSPFIIGLLVIGIDPEETIASVVAAMNGLVYIAVGNAIGNSIFSLALCFALPIIFYKIDFTSISQFYFIILYVCMVLILLSFLIPFGLLIFGILLCAIYLAYTYRNLKSLSKKGQVEVIDIDDVIKEIKEGEEELKDSSKLLKIFLVIVSFIFIFIGGELLILSAEQLIVLTDIPEEFFGFIIIAFVTNVEELTLVFKSIKKKSLEIGLGGMIGKVIWNLTLTFGISGIIAVNIEFSWILIWNWLIFLIIIIYFNTLSIKKMLKKTDGIVLISLLVTFLGVNFWFLIS